MFIGWIRIRMNVHSCEAYEGHYRRAAMSQQKNYVYMQSCAVRTEAKSCAEW